MAIINRCKPHKYGGFNQFEECEGVLRPKHLRTVVLHQHLTLQRGNWGHNRWFYPPTRGQLWLDPISENHYLHCLFPLLHYYHDDLHMNEVVSYSPMRKVWKGSYDGGQLRKPFSQPGEWEAGVGQRASFKQWVHPSGDVGWEQMSRFQETKNMTYCELRVSFPEYNELFLIPWPFLQGVCPLESEQLGSGKERLLQFAIASCPRVYPEHPPPGKETQPATGYRKPDQKVRHPFSTFCHPWR